MVKIVQNYYTKNRCYTRNNNYKKVGIIVHSTATPGVMAASFQARWNNATVAKDVHCFLDDTVAIECLPHTREAWHVGTSTGNKYYYGFEICEDRDHSKAYFLKAYKNAVEFTAVMVKRLGLSVDDIFSHKEGNKKGIASNHGDPEHWFSKFGYTMNDFRRDVASELNIIRPIGVGDKGVYVRELQTNLELLGYQITPDGSYGPATEKTVIQFQKDNKLLVDGIAGPQTQAKIDALIEIKNNPPQRKLTRVPEGKIIRIRVGAYTIEEYAEEFLASVHAKGLTDAYASLEDR